MLKEGLHKFRDVFIAPELDVQLPGEPFALERRSRRKHEWLRSNGSSVQADLERVELNTSVQVNGTSPYRIVCQWLNPMTNQVHVFKSENLWFDPSKYVTGNSVQVLIDPDNPRRYWVETGFLPKIAE